MLDRPRVRAFESFATSQECDWLVERCRHHLKPAPDGALKVEVYDSGTGAYILRQGKRWYVTETKNCQLQQFKEPPPEPGTLLGAFRVKGGELRFVAAESKEKGGDEDGNAKGG